MPRYVHLFKFYQIKIEVPKSIIIKTWQDWVRFMTHWIMRTHYCSSIYFRNHKFLKNNMTGIKTMFPQNLPVEDKFPDLDISAVYCSESF